MDCVSISLETESGKESPYLTSLTAERVRELLDYDLITGVWRWKKPTANAVKVGQIAGGENAKGYWYIRIDGVLYKGSRLAWLYVHGVWPTHEIDHKNGATGDDSFGNLREATHQQNAWNRSIRYDNYLGIKGVRQNYNKFEANICFSGQNIYLGLFDSPEEASTAYQAAAKALFGEFYNG